MSFVLWNIAAVFIEKTPTNLQELLWCTPLHATIFFFILSLFVLASTVLCTKQRQQKENKLDRKERK